MLYNMNKPNQPNPVKGETRGKTMMQGMFSNLPLKQKNRESAYSTDSRYFLKWSERLDSN